MKPLLVRDVMMIGVPVCRDTETCGAVAVRLGEKTSRVSRSAPEATRSGVETCEVCVVLDKDGMACGWLTRERLATEAAARPVGEVMDEDIPTIAPNIPAQTAAQIMRDRGVEFLFLMHDWPGEPRPSAVVSLKDVEKRLHEAL
jgi:CBS domain-containing protein